MRILFISPYVPSRIRVRPYNWVKYLAAQGHEITLLSLVAGDDDEAALPDMKAICKRVIPVAMPRWRPIWNSLLAIPSKAPLQLAYSRLPAMEKQITHLLATESFDVAHIEHLRAACFGNALKGLPVVYDAVDSISLLFERTAANNSRLSTRLMAGIDLSRTRRFESQVLNRFSRVLVTSPDDADQFQRLSSSRRNFRNLITLPNGVDLDYFKPNGHVRRANVLIFSGKMSYHANIAAVLYLVEEIMPLIWQQRPDIELWIVGKGPNQTIKDLANDHRITVTGFVPDFRPYLGEATISVSPLRYGTGIQNKVLEAMACGTPVITSSQACKALDDIKIGHHLLAADGPATFAEDVLILLASKVLQNQLAQGGRQYVEARHNWQVLTRDLTEVYQKANAEYQSEVK